MVCRCVCCIATNGPALQPAQDNDSVLTKSLFVVIANLKVSPRPERFELPTCPSYLFTRYV